MHLKTFVALLFLTPALASPVTSDDDDMAKIQALAESLPVPASSATTTSVPNSILTVLETAIPASWYEEIMDASSRSALISEIEAGTLPAWYNSLPSSVKAWASAQGGFAENFVGATTAALDDTTTVKDATPATASAINTATATTTQKKASSNSTATSGATSSSETSTASVSPSTATSTGGAPVATAGVAMGFAGVAGLLGLAIVL
ncbi:uncharacterized protein N7503_009703 [Penicillium pulvis]|uniref:uncharacterized protein n=1 Tax=Penicillium pulvis TaxID=1562058 RepID=UPI0025489EE0|nr:uncharacterized protein N7503_009703 [Penicillium pulvis]KAJ5784491.1 hypothetical protein N7503_009703 [Penicillium pulvis]